MERFGDSKMVVKRLGEKDVPRVIHEVANYWRGESFFTRMANADDAYDFYVSNFGHCFEHLVKYGECFEYKGSILCAVDYDEWMKDRPEVTKEIFSTISTFMTWINGTEDVKFVISLVNTKDKLYSRDTMKLLKWYVSQNKNQFVVTDSISSVNEHAFETETTAEVIYKGGLKYYVWRKGKV